MTELIAPSSFPPVHCTKPLANPESGAGADVLDISVLPQLPARAPSPHTPPALPKLWQHPKAGTPVPTSQDQWGMRGTSLSIRDPQGSP